MKLNVGVIMDPINAIHIKKDSTFAMLLEVQARGWDIFYMNQEDLSLCDGIAWGTMRKLKVRDDHNLWYEFLEEKTQPLSALDIILMRKDPPVETNYIYTTHILEIAAHQGVWVINNPRALRDFNEKLFISWFPECCPPTLVSAKAKEVKNFLAQYGDIICKPLNGMGGAAIFRLQQQDPNINVVLEVLTDNGKSLMVAQKYIPAIKEGDKRILMIDGDPYPYALARLAPEGETRANLAVGGRGIGVELTAHDRWLCDRIGPVLREQGLLFVGIDVIGDYLTEINITSPTCIRELDAIYKTNISAQLFDCVANKLAAMRD